MIFKFAISTKIHIQIFFRFFKFEVPGECLPRIQRELLEEVPGMLSDMNEVRQEVVNEYEKKCVYEGTVYNNGEQWKATHDSCKMCSCKR